MPSKAFFDNLGQDAQNKYAQGQVTPNVNGQMWPEFELRDFMPVLVTCKFDHDRIKNKVVMSCISFLHYKPMGKIFNAQGHVTLS